jgi:energy-converting hydrogenase A subunit M
MEDAKIPIDKKKFVKNQSIEERIAYQRQIVQSISVLYEEKTQEEIVDMLTQRLDNSLLEGLFDHIEQMIISFIKEEGLKNEQILKYLDSNPLPIMLEDALPTQDRIYYAIFAALRDIATQKVREVETTIFATSYKKHCLSIFNQCIITKEPLNKFNFYLQPAVRDGRPPVPISTKGLMVLDRLAGNKIYDPLHPIEQHRNSFPEGKRYTWRLLYNGCLLMLGFNLEYANSEEAKKIARRVERDTKMNFQEIIEYLKNSEKVG